VVLCAGIRSPDKKLAAYPLDWVYAQHYTAAVLNRSGIVTGDSGIVTAHSGIPRKSGHVQPEWLVTMRQSRRSRWPRITGHVEPEYPPISPNPLSNMDRLSHLLGERQHINMGVSRNQLQSLMPTDRCNLNGSKATIP
jgi:hypothetical protein